MNSNLGMSEIRKINRQNIVFSVFKSHSRLSKHEVKKISLFSMSTVISTTDELLAKGYIEQCGIGKSSGGRPPVYYRIKESGGYSIGIDFSCETIYVTINNLNGNIVDTFTKKLNYQENDIYKIINLTIDLTKKIISKHGIEDRILCMGIATPGLVDIEEGMLLYYAYFNDCHNIPVRDLFSKHFNYPIFIDKNINCITYAFKESNTSDDSNNLILISIRSGIGMGCILNGSLYRGTSGNSGEIGHIRVSPSMAKCRCGKIGCLESEVSSYAIERKMTALLHDNPTYQSPETSSSLEKIDLLITMVKKGIPEALRLLDEICFYLATISAQLVNILNPKRIVFFGELTKCGEVFLESIEKYIYKESFSINAKHLSLEIADLPKSAGAQGAGAYALANYFLPIDIAKLALSNKKTNRSYNSLA